jgi:hypothetical protein
MSRPDYHEHGHVGTGITAVLLGLLSLIAFPVGINVAAYFLFSGHPTYDTAQGLGSMICWLSIPAAPLGTIYWLCWGVIASSSKNGVGLGAGLLGFLGLTGAVTVCIRIICG